MWVLLYTSSAGAAIVLIAFASRIIREAAKSSPKFGQFSGDPRVRSSGRLNDEYVKSLID